MIRYSFTNNLTEATPLLAFVAITVVLSVISYKYVEKMKKTKVSWGFIALLVVLTTAGVSSFMLMQVLCEMYLNWKW